MLAGLRQDTLTVPQLITAEKRPTGSAQQAVSLDTQHIRPTTTVCSVVQMTGKDNRKTTIASVQLKKENNRATSWVIV